MHSTMNKLPKDVQSLICASSLINSYIKAVQELVYNSLDANATSIAVRVNIELGMIQVVDNGCGIQKEDFEKLGKKYMSSKLVDISTLKSAPTMYGFRGRALSNLIQISECLKITSRCDGTETTFSKIFKHGKEKEIAETNTRPSKGTTVEIKGFLYNLGVQKKSITNITELQNIKTFLERISLVHCGVSISLRDDSNNEIILKVHKNRDIYQTLSSLYDVQKTDMQELQIEKNSYKVKAYIGKNADDVILRYIYLNGKYLTENSKVHKVVNQNLNRLKVDVTKNIKTKKMYDQGDKDIANNQIPNYCIFVSCPYMNYDVIEKGKETMAEFKNWDQVKKLLEKLIQFYHGDLKLKDINTVQNKENQVKDKTGNTREQVKKIIDRILGSNTKKPEISHMQNGIKGKLIKRKKNKKNVANISLSKILDSKKDKHLDKHKEKQAKKLINQNNFNSINNIITVEKEAVYLPSPKFEQPKVRTRHNKVKKKKKRKSKISLAEKFAMETDTVKQRCKLLEQETNELLQSIRRKLNREIHVNGTIEYSNIITNNKNISIRKEVDEIIIRDYTRCAKPHKQVKPNYVEKPKDDKNTFKSTYDLVQTILNSQREINRGYDFEMISNHNAHEVNKDANVISTHLNYNIGSINESSVLPTGTFQSHNYHIPSNETDDINNNFNMDIALNNIDLDSDYRAQQFGRKRSKSFITKKSIDNFINSKTNGVKNLFHKAKSDRRFDKSLHRKQNLFNFDDSMFRNGIHSSYTIEFSKSKDKCMSVKSNNIFQSTTNTASLGIDKTVYSIDWTKESYMNTICKDDDNSQRENILDKNIISAPNTINETLGNETEFDNLIIRPTYTIEKAAPTDYCNSNNSILNQTVNKVDTPKTYTVESWNENHLFDKRESPTGNKTNNSVNYVFISTPNNENEIIDPIDVCETIINSQEVQHEFQNSYNYNSYNNANDINEPTSKVNSAENICLHSPDEVSHHFTLTSNNIEMEIPVTGVNKDQFETKGNDLEVNYGFETEANKNDLEPNQVLKDFNIENRLCFLPKGLSQIFQNCNSKAVCSYNLNEEYYEDKIYDDFANKIQNKVEIFEPRVQEARDLTTKDIDKVNTKLNKDVASLKFDSDSLKQCKILGQVDAKFIAVTIKGKSIIEESEFLVLFDQHAVHERIRLENNLSEYFTENQWKSVQLDEVSLKLSKDDVRFLHNYKKKFNPLGLQWTILNNEISITGIPEAILGKNPRPVDKILKAVTNLIKEEINNIKLQSGCISIQPKSILDLVYSEACRYAIKFGDQLSKAECCELINMLSNCKTPFQCAHGRPVMAVIMDIKPYAVNYKIDITKLKKYMLLSKQ